MWQSLCLCLCCFFSSVFFFSNSDAKSQVFIIFFFSFHSHSSPPTGCKEKRKFSYKKAQDTSFALPFYLWANANYIFICSVSNKHGVRNSNFGGILLRMKRPNTKRRPAHIDTQMKKKKKRLCINEWRVLKQNRNSVRNNVQGTSHRILYGCGQSQSNERVFHINFTCFMMNAKLYGIKAWSKIYGV